VRALPQRIGRRMQKFEPVPAATREVDRLTAREGGGDERAGVQLIPGGSVRHQAGRRRVTGQLQHAAACLHRETCCYMLREARAFRPKRRPEPASLLVVLMPHRCQEAPRGGRTVRLRQTDLSSTASRLPDASGSRKVRQARARGDALAGPCLSPTHPVSRTVGIDVHDAARLQHFYLLPSKKREILRPRQRSRVSNSSVRRTLTQSAYRLQCSLVTRRP
jgi:hypothetical protein